MKFVTSIRDRLLSSLIVWLNVFFFFFKKFLKTRRFKCLHSIRLILIHVGYLMLERESSIPRLISMGDFCVLFLHKAGEIINFRLIHRSTRDNNNNNNNVHGRNSKCVRRQSEHRERKMNSQQFLFPRFSCTTTTTFKGRLQRVVLPPLADDELNNVRRSTGHALFSYKDKTRTRCSVNARG